MRVLLPLLLFLLLLSGCATVDGEQLALESVAAGEATWNPCTGYADKKLNNPVEAIRKAIVLGDVDGLDKARRKLIDLMEGQRTFGERFSDAYYGHNEHSRNIRKIASDLVMNELKRLGSTAGPRVVDAVRQGFPIEWLIPGEQTQALEGEPISPVQLVPTLSAPGKRLAGVALCTHARLTPFQMKVWTGKQEAQETKSNQRDETSDFPQIQSDQQQYLVFQQPHQLIPTSGGSALLGPITPNAYGPGLNSDATGRPFMWKPQFGGSGYPDPTLRVQPNAYGPGIGMDQYGRPVTPACPPGWAGPC